MLLMWVVFRINHSNRWCNF